MWVLQPLLVRPSQVSLSWAVKALQSGAVTWWPWFLLGGEESLCGWRHRHDCTRSCDLGLCITRKLRGPSRKILRTCNDRMCKWFHWYPGWMRQAWKQRRANLEVRNEESYTNKCPQNDRVGNGIYPVGRWRCIHSLIRIENVFSWRFVKV